MSAASDSDFLQGMAASSQARNERAISLLSAVELVARLADAAPVVPLHLSAEGFDLIAEVKRQSPAEGQLSDGQLDPQAQARLYADGGAAAISVLTEPERFAGSLEDLQRVTAELNDVPVMRKDFLVSDYQVREARLAGASGVLLIAAILDAEQLARMLKAALELDMFVLLEVFDQADLDKALPVLEAVGQAEAEGRVRYLLGVNCRNLRTLEVDFEHFSRLAKDLPASIPCVAESGLQTTTQARQLVALGYRLALAGTTLMKSADPQQAVADLLTAGRAQCL
jgi:indole-3-glycerol phosphate synthase